MWSMICFRFFLLLSKTKIFFAEFRFGYVAVVVSMTCFLVLILWQKNWQQLQLQGLSFIVKVFVSCFCKRKAPGGRPCVQTSWSDLNNDHRCARFWWPALLCNYDPNFGKILYQKESSSGSSLCVFFRGDITSWHIFVKSMWLAFSIRQLTKAHLTGLNQFTVACLRLRRWTLLRPLSPRWPCSPRPPSWRSCAAARSMAWCATWGHSPAFAGWGLWIWDSPTLNDQPRPADGLLDLPFPHRLCHASYASWEVCIFYRPWECWAHRSHLAIYGSISSFSMPEIENEKIQNLDFRMKQV